jgi:lipopolysaccharide/colanic/teichoic acid biosynthesis glycosyltransferase
MEIAGQLSIPPALAGSSRYPVLKRVLDVVLASVLLIGLSWLLALCALAVWLDSRGPILFRQRRAGEQGKLFTMLKFRTRRVNADQGSHQSYAAAFINGKAAASTGTGGQVFKMVSDPRITRVGRILRKTSLDELPQLWNVLVGEMSMVGPRPPIPYELDHYKPAHLQRLSVRPGITGLWQVGGRSSTTFEQMVALDLDYIRRRSIWLDLRIIVSTIPVVLTTKSGN